VTIKSRKGGRPDMARRNRIIYPSNSVWANGNVLYRVMTFGSTTTFNTEDIFELGQLKIIDVVDDSPTVAVTIETDEFGSISNLYHLANLEFDEVVNQSATSVLGHLAVVSGIGAAAANIAFYHGVALTDFGLSGCETGSAVEIWAPIQSECSLGTSNSAIDQTMYLPRVFVNSIEWTYSAGSNAAENFGAETDSKFWFTNAGRFISNEEFVYAVANDADVNTGVTGGTGFKVVTTATTVFLGLDEAPNGGADPAQLVSTRSTGQLAFLRFDAFGTPAVRYYNVSTKTSFEVPVEAGTVAVNGSYVYNSADNGLIDPLDLTTNAELLGEAKGEGDILFVIYAANAYANAWTDLEGATQASRGGGAQADSAMATRRDAEYFAPIEIDASAKPEDVGAVRQGQVEIYLIDKDVLDPGFTLDSEIALRVTSVTISADLTREPLFELSHLRPYDRSLTFPIPFTATVETTATDLTEYATFASKKTGVVINKNVDEVSIFDFMTANGRLDLAVLIYQQTDEEAGGVGSQRRVVTREMVGDEYYQRGQRFIYYDGAGNDPDGDPVPNNATEIPDNPTKASTHRERPLKTVIAKDLRITDEAYSLSLGENATQTYGFRGTNRLFAILGEVDSGDFVADPGFEINPAAARIS
jgi:hypothetical protein